MKQGRGRAGKGSGMFRNQDGVKTTLTELVLQVIPKQGSITSAEIVNKLRRQSVSRDVSSITGILRHLKARDLIMRMPRSKDDHRNILHRWARSKIAEVMFRPRVIQAPVSPGFTKGVLAEHWHGVPPFERHYHPEQ